MVDERSLERRKWLIPATSLSYRNRVLSWLVKQTARGRKAKEWEAYCGKHLDPFLHSENSLLVFLRHHGVVREATALHYLSPVRGVSGSTQQQPPDAQKDKRALERDAMQKSERSLINDLFPTDSAAHNQGKTEPAPIVKRFVEDIKRAPSLPLQKLILGEENDTSGVPNYLNFLQDFERERQILIQDVQELWYGSYDFDPSPEPPLHWFKFGAITDKRLLPWSPTVDEMAGMYQREELLHQATLALAMTGDELNLY